ncbi:alpha/beta hydrolase [Candidatus Micrarchaeota archaeon]|nr:alpha/beta hydrolase [Candidatus Micrarchaeota archaeon]
MKTTARAPAKGDSEYNTATPLSPKRAGITREITVIPGFTRDISDFRALEPLAEEGYTIRARNPRAIGKTPRGKKTNTQTYISKVARDIIDSIGKIRADKTILVAHSAGALVALEALSQIGRMQNRPQIDKLVLITPLLGDPRDTFPSGKPLSKVATALSTAFASNIDRVIKQGGSEEQIARAVRLMFGTFDVVGKAGFFRMLGLNATASREFRSFVEGVNKSSDEVLALGVGGMFSQGPKLARALVEGEISLPPTQIILAHQDALIGDLEVREVLSRADDQVQSKVIIQTMDCGHFPMHERPAELVGRIREFINEQED